MGYAAVVHVAVQQVQQSGACMLSEHFSRLPLAAPSGRVASLHARVAATAGQPRQLTGCLWPHRAPWRGGAATAAALPVGASRVPFQARYPSCPLSSTLHVHANKDTEALGGYRSTGCHSRALLVALLPNSPGPQPTHDDGWRRLAHSKELVPGVGRRGALDSCTTGSAGSMQLWR